MRIPGLKTLQRSARWIRSQLGTGALILGYHRVADEPYDHFGICVNPRHFAEHLDVLQQYAHLVSLSGLVDGMRTRTFPHRAVAITLDDGYADTLDVAKPLLVRYSAPATVFVATGYLGGFFWWDELAGIVGTMGNLSQGIRLSVNDRTFAWEPVKMSRSGPGQGAIIDRENLLRSLYAFMLNLSVEARQQVFSQLAAVDQNRRDIGNLPRALATDEVVQLAQDGNIEIGSHSVAHPRLADLADEEQRFEVQNSKSCLEDLLGKPVTGFSYPNGSATQDTRNFVREAGYRFACASTSSVTRPNSDPYQLPRFWIPDWDGDTFARWLVRWLPLK